MISINAKIETIFIYLKLIINNIIVSFILGKFGILRRLEVWMYPLRKLKK